MNTKKLIYSFLVTIIIISIDGCSLSKNHSDFLSNDLLPKKQKVWYEVGVERWPEKEALRLHDCDPYLLDTTKFKEYQSFIIKMMKEALNQNIPLFHPTYYDNIYIMEDSAKKINNPDSSIQHSFNMVSDNKEPYDSIENEINYNELKSLIFLENWYFNIERLIFSKEVFGYCPVRRFYSIDVFGVYSHLLKTRIINIFPEKYIENDKQLKVSNKRMEYLGTMKYEFQLNQRNCFKTNGYSDELPVEGGFVNDFWAPQLTNSLIERILEEILRNAFNGTISVYDYENPNQKLSIHQIKNNCDYLADTIQIMPTDTETTEEIMKIRKPDLNIEEYKALIFEEEVYIDWQTFRMKKKVKTITPVKYTANEYWNGDVLLEKTPVFTIRLN